MVYANADITKAEQAREVIAFADYWQHVAGTDPGLLVFDSQLTTYTVLDELAARGITFLTLRQRGTSDPRTLAALPASAWKTAQHQPRRPLPPPPDLTKTSSPSTASQPGAPDRHPQHRPRPTHPADHQRPDHPGQGPVHPLRRTHDHRERTRRLHLRLPPQRPLQRPPAQRRPRHHPDRCRRQLLPLLARNLPRYETATPDKLWRHFLDTTGTIHVTDHHRHLSTSTCAPTTPSSSTPASPTSTSPSPGGTTEPSASASHHAEPGSSPTSTRISSPGIEAKRLWSAGKTGTRARTAR